MVLGLEAQDLQYLAERLQMEYSEFMKFRIAFLDLDKLSGISLIFDCTYTELQIVLQFKCAYPDADSSENPSLLPRLCDMALWIKKTFLKTASTTEFCRP